MRPRPRQFLSTVSSPARYVLRGVSQILFVGNAVSGLLILCALVVVDPRLPALVLLGSAVQSLAGWGVGLRTDVRHGLMGYNGALVGGATGLSTGLTQLSVPLTVAGALACVAVHQLVRWLFASPALARFSLPVATAPFCLVAGLFAAVVGQPAPAATPVTGVVPGLLTSFSGVLLVDGLLCGVLILAALLLASPPAAAFGAGGAVVAFVATTAVRGAGTAATGGYGYSAVLVAVTFGSLLWTDRRPRTRVLGAVIGVVLVLLIQPVLALTPVPVFTWPFLVAMWLVLIGGHLMFPERRPVTARTPEHTAVEPAGRPARRGTGETR